MLLPLPKKAEDVIGITGDDKDDNVAATALVDLVNASASPPENKIPLSKSHPHHTSWKSTRKRKGPPSALQDVSLINTESVARSAAADLLPKRTVLSTTLEAMNKQRKLSSIEANRGCNPIMRLNTVLRSRLRCWIALRSPNGPTLVDGDSMSVKL